MSDAPEPIKSIVTPVRLEYDFTAGRAASLFLHGLAQRKIIGARSGPGAPVLVPPRGADPRSSELAQEAVEVADTGTVITYSVIRVPSENIHFELPYACVNVLLDGASIGFFHVLQNCPLDEVRIGMRVRARWVDDADLGPSVASIQYFEPTGEPDVPYEQIKDNT